MKLRVHAFAPCSYANGPGRRAVIWVQGCTHNCPGCFNPRTHDPDGGREYTVDELHEKIRILYDGRREPIEGITISGGEPLQQAMALLDLLGNLRVRLPDLGIILFTGYEIEEAKEEVPYAQELFDQCDVIIAGRYRWDKVPSGMKELNLVGSTNQQVVFQTRHYNINDLSSSPSAEVIISPGGSVMHSGIYPYREIPEVTICRE